MADLSETESTLSVKIIGSDNAGTETTPVNSSANGEILASDIVNSVSQFTMTLTTTPQAINASGSNLTNRKLIQIESQGSNIVYGYALASQPFTLPKGTDKTWTLGPGVTIYAKTTSSTAVIAGAEFS